MGGVFCELQSVFGLFDVVEIFGDVGDYVGVHVAAETVLEQPGEFGLAVGNGQAVLAQSEVVDDLAWN